MTLRLKGPSDAQPPDAGAAGLRGHRAGVRPQDAIVVDGLAKRYPNGTEGVRGISFGVRAGQVFGIGPNGAGQVDDHGHARHARAADRRGVRRWPAYMEEADRLCDRIAIVDYGRVGDHCMRGDHTVPAVRKRSEAS
jgi:hypothetical protein